MMQKRSILRLISCCHLVLNAVSEVNLTGGNTSSVIEASSVTLPQHERETSETTLHSFTSTLSQPIDAENPSPGSKDNVPFQYADSRRSQTVSFESPNCHDSPSYRNPLIPSLTCQNHTNTSCEGWEVLGMNTAQVKELLSSCPVSCKMPCSSLPSSIPFEIELEFSMHNVDSEIKEEDKDKFQKASLDYLSSYLITSDSYDSIILSSFILSSQTFVNNTIHHHIRKLSDSRTLQVVANINAAITNNDTVKKEEIIKTLYRGIESRGYIVLIKSILRFQDVTVSSNSRQELNQRAVNLSDGLVVSSDAIVAISVSLALLACIIISIILHRRRIRLKQFRNLSHQHHHHEHKFDDVSYESRNFGKNDNTNTNNSKAKLHTYRGRILKLRVDECDMKRSVKASSESSSRKEEPTPATLIPPMIVIDNIDDEITESSHNRIMSSDGKTVSEGQKDDIVMRVSNMGGPSAIAASFSANMPANSMQARLLFKGCNPCSSSQVEFEKDDKSPLSLISSRPSIGETESAVSTPASNVIGQGKHRKFDTHSLKKYGVFNFDPDIDMEPEDDFTVLFEKKMKEGGKRSFNLKDFFKRNKMVEEENSSVDMSHYEAESELSDISSVVRCKDSVASLGHGLSPFNQTFLHEPEVRKSIIESKSPSHQQEPISTHDNKENILSIAKNKDGIASDKPSSASFFYSFEAPTSGKLGIVIRSPLQQRVDKHQMTPTKLSQEKRHFGPTVWQIKGYSPLLGMVQPGDIITSFDGINTINMKTDKITALLETKKRTEKGENNGKIKITVLSTEIKAGFEPDSSEEQNFDKLKVPDSIDLSTTNDGNSNTHLSSESDGSFHLIGIGVSDDDDSFHMMAGAEDFL